MAYSARVPKPPHKPLIEALEGRRLLAADNLAVNAGGGDYTDPTGLKWEASRGFNTSTTAQTVTANNAISGTDLDPLFKTARQDFNMKFATSLADGTYDVSLYFAEQRSTSVGQRVFDVSIENGTVLNDFDIYKTAGKNAAVIKTFTVTVADGTLNIDFKTGSTRALINAIRVKPDGGPTEPTTPTEPTGPGDFKPGTISWSTKASSPFAREEAVTFVSGGKMYVIGGYYNSDFDATKRVDVYDPSTNKWSRKKDAPSKITHAGMAVDSSTGTVWLVAGFIGDFPAPPGTDAVWKYSPASDTWSRGPDLPVARGAGGSAIVDGKLYFMGGATADRKSQSTNCYVLDLKDQSAGWKSIAGMPAARNHLGVTAVGGKIYAIGGQTGVEAQASFKTDVYVYDPDTNQWTSTTKLPASYSHFANAIAVYKNRYIMIAGGEAPHNTARSEVYLFDTQTKKWAKLTNLPSGRRTGVGVIIGTKFVYSTGYKSGQFQNTTWTADLTKLGL